MLPFLFRITCRDVTFEAQIGETKAPGAPLEEPYIISQDMTPAWRGSFIAWSSTLIFSKSPNSCGERGGEFRVVLLLLGFRGPIGQILNLGGLFCVWEVWLWGCLDSRTHFQDKSKSPFLCLRCFASTILFKNKGVLQLKTNLNFAGGLKRGPFSVYTTYHVPLNLRCSYKINIFEMGCTL